MANSYRDVPLANKTLLIGLSRNPGQWVLNEDVESEISKIKAEYRKWKKLKTDNLKRTKLSQSRGAEAKESEVYDHRLKFENEPEPFPRKKESLVKENTLPKRQPPFGESGAKRASCGPWLWRPLPLRPKVRKLDQHKKRCRFCRKSFDKNKSLKNHLGQKHKKERKVERRDQAQVFNTAQNQDSNDQVC